MPLGLAPNPRLQRTRSASPPSPLSRQPLGNRKSLRLVGAIVLAGALLVSLAACSSAAPPSPRPPAVAQSPDILFDVVLAGKRPALNLSGVEVSLVAGDGRIVSVGKTFAGHIRVSKARIRELGATVILFCGETTFCGAVLVSQPGFSILDFDEYYLELAPMVVV
jgi:hypothetical protein